MTTRYEDWVPTEPDPSDPTFQTQIAVRYMDAAAQPKEDAPTQPGGLFKYQVFDKEFFRSFDKQLLFYEAGTGKTCAYVSVAEDYHTVATESRIGAFTDALVAFQQAYQGVIKRAHILLKGDSLEEEFRRQLTCKCTPGTYLTDKVTQSKSKKAQDQNLTRLINTWYKVDTYIKFYNRLVKANMTEEEMAAEFEGTLFILDEIHFLQLRELLASDDDRAEMAPEDASVPEPKADEEPTADEKRRNTRVYQMLWKVVHAPTWCKVIAATATPMINDPEDFINPINLLLPKDKQVPARTDLTAWTLDQFRERFSGLISYVRAGDIGVDTVFVGRPLDVPGSQMVVERVPMSPRQDVVYARVLQEQKRNVRNDERQVSNFVFPNGDYGGRMERNKVTKELIRTRGLSLYVDSPQKDVYTRNKRWLKDIKTLEDIRQCSGVYAAIIEGILRGPGICYVYEELYTGSGVLALAMCLETMGFQRYRPQESPYGGSAATGLCASTESGRAIKPMKKALRYGMITEDTSHDHDTYLLELLKSNENIEGEYVKVLLGSKVIRDGINLANVVRVFLPSMWTPSGMYQAMQRAIRATSHVELVKRSPTGRVAVSIHRMASVSATGESVDLDIYATAEEKDKQIAKVRRMVRQVATDCWLHYNLNARAGGVDYTPECDYELCHYTCVDPQPTVEDVKRWGLPALANPDKVKALLQEGLPQVFSYGASFSLSTLVEWLKDTYAWNEIYTALLQARREHLLYRNRYGQVGELTWAGDEVALVPPGQGALGAWYRDGLVTLELQTLESLAVKRLSEKAPEPGTPGAAAATPLQAAQCVEAALAAGQPIPKRWESFVYVFRKPTRALAERQQDLARPRRGAPAKYLQYQEGTLPASAEEGPDEVTVHTLRTIPENLRGYDAVSSYVLNVDPKGRKRFRVLEGGVWRDTTDAEEIVYDQLVRGRINGRLQPLIDSRLYGSVFGDGTFRIHDLRSVPPEAQTDARKQPRGVDCAGGKMDAASANALLLALGEPPVTAERRTRAELCGLLQDAFERHGRLFRVFPRP